jgi:hypothetical protein
MRPDALKSKGRDSAIGAAAGGAGLGLTAVVCLAALAAAVIAGRVIFVQFFHDGWRLFASALS